MQTSKEYREIARESLKGIWGKMIIISLLGSFLGAGIFPLENAFMLFPISFLIGSFASLGYQQICRDVLDYREPLLSDLFYFSDVFFHSLALRLKVLCLTLLWSLLLIVPGIIKAYSYSMAGYLLSLDPDMNTGEAIRQSKELMKGNKWKLFCLQFSFIGWILLSLVTLGLGFLVVRPYMQIAITAFFDDIYYEEEN